MLNKIMVFKLRFLFLLVSDTPIDAKKSIGVKKPRYQKGTFREVSITLPKVLEWARIINTQASPLIISRDLSLIWLASIIKYVRL